MENGYGPLLFEGELTPDQRDELRSYLDEHPDLASDWARWQKVRRRLRRRLDARLPDRRLLVLYALEQEGRQDLLTPAERTALDDARDEIAEAVELFPALEQVIDRIQEERDDFETVWAQHRAAQAQESSEAGERARSDRTDRAPKRSTRGSRAGIRPWAWRFTVAVLLLGVAVLAVFYGPRETSRTTVAVEAGEQDVVEFGEGSMARLVGAARLSYRPTALTSGDRQVTLERGRAYFDVVHREDASFVVNTPTARTRVLGTEFAVTVQSDTTEVVLIDGRVEVGSVDGDAPTGVVLEPGERSRVERGGSPSAPVSVDVTTNLEWTGLFVFRSASVQKIARRMSAHYGVSITTAPSLQDETVTATFDREQPVGEVLTALTRTLDAELEQENGDYRLVPAS